MGRNGSGQDGMGQDRTERDGQDGRVGMGRTNATVRTNGRESRDLHSSSDLNFFQIRNSLSQKQTDARFYFPMNNKTKNAVFTSTLPALHIRSKC